MDATARFAETLPAPSVAVVPRLEPYLVEVILPFPLGSADQAVAEAAAAVAALLADAAFTGRPTAPTAEPDDASLQIANTAFVQAVARTVTQAARTIARDAIRDLFTKPGALKALLPTELPDRPELPWLDGGTLVITPSA